jgi:hypothetical protein
MATGGNFDDELTLLDEGGVRVVKAKGPLEANTDLKEICVWIIQQQENGGDVAFTEMTTTMKNRDDFGQDLPVGRPEPREWRLTVGKIDTPQPGDLVAGRPAVAMAIALMADGAGADAPLKTLQWAQSVRLVDGSASV